MKVSIRPERPGDYDKIDEVIEAAFNQRNEAVLVRKLRGTKEFVPGLSLVATADNGIIGHILLYPITFTGGVTLVLAPMAVKPELQKRGVGKKLITEGLKKAAENGYGSVIVVGHPEYYPKFGFEKASKCGLRMSFDVPDEAFMAIELKKDSLKGKGGLIELPQPYLECA